MKPVVRYILSSEWFLDPDRWYARYSWPVEFVVRAIREIGWTGFSVDSTRTPLTNMGQTLFEPPNVSGWELGAAWFSTSAMLARMNFASTLAANQRFNLARSATSFRATPEALLDFFMFERLSPAPIRSAAVQRAVDVSDRRRAVDRLGRAGRYEDRRTRQADRRSG